LRPVGRNREDAARSQRADQEDQEGGRGARSPRGRAGERGASTPARIAVVLAAVIAVAVAVALIFNSDSGHKYTLLFQTGGQLVPGNQVLVAGQVVGSVDSIDLTEDNQAAVNVTMDEPLREGTTAVIRSTSLSGVANRYVSLTLGPNNADEIPDGDTITGDDTTAPVDLDQLFNVFREKQRTSLKKFIEGNATVYAGKQKLANRAYKFINPSFSTSEKLFAEVSSDSAALSRLLISGGQVFDAVASRRQDLTDLITNANGTLQAISNRNEDLDRSLAALPQTLRQANTTFVNLRATLDDLDPLVTASYPATKHLAPFLRRLRLVSTDAVPVFGNLSSVVHLPGAHNDLADALKTLPAVRDQARTAFPATIDAMDASQDEITQLRPYSPDLMAFISRFAAATAYYDGNGHYARVMPTAANVFDYQQVTPNTANLQPQYTNPAAQFDDIQTIDPIRRCPGAGAPPLSDGSNPFLDGGNLNGICDPGQLPPTAAP
jgi:phospholipid/cholesterol/gamma-HCH transport system substrate-binding protein